MHLGTVLWTLMSSRFDFSLVNLFIIFYMFQSVLSELSGKGWNKLINVGDIKEGEVKALFNLIHKDKSGALSIDVNISISYNILSISSQEARNACKLIQARFEITEVDDWMSTVDKDKDDSLSYQEFRQSLEGKMEISE